MCWEDDGSMLSSDVNILCHGPLFEFVALAIENAQVIAAHESPRTTKLYDRTSDVITLDEVERILI